MFWGFWDLPHTLLLSRHALWKFARLNFNSWISILSPIWGKRIRAESAILPHKRQNKQCSWQKSFLFPAHRGSFSMSSLQTHKHRRWWASNVTRTHLPKCEERRRIKTKKNQSNHGAKEKKDHCFCSSCNASFNVCLMLWWMKGCVSGPLFGPQAELLLPVSNYIADDETTSWGKKGFEIFKLWWH